MKPLVTLTGDGTFRAPTPQEALALHLPDDPHLAALLRLRALLGDDLEEQIATRLYLPSALGLDETDHLLPSTLALLAETTGDLVSYGWRLGTGTGLAWQHARELRERMLDAARIAMLGYEGALMTTALGPATLAGATFLQSGERTLGDPGAVRDLPMLLAEGLVGHLATLQDRVPGAQLHVLLREDAVAAVHESKCSAAAAFEPSRIARLTTATVCGSDRHTVRGRRPGACPRRSRTRGHRRGRGFAVWAPARPTRGLLGHLGMREVQNCRRGLSAKCQSVAKVGHESTDSGWALSGTYASTSTCRPAWQSSRCRIRCQTPWPPRRTYLHDPSFGNGGPEKRR